MAMFFCVFVLIIYNSVLSVNSLNDGCDENKDQKIVKLEEEVARSKLIFKDVYQRIADMNQLGDWLEEVTDIVQSTRKRISSVSSRSKRHGIERRATASNANICENQRDHVRLINGSTPGEGRIEIFVGNEWSPVSLTGFGPKDASIICSALGYNGLHGFRTSHVLFGDGSDNLLVPLTCLDSVGVICEDFHLYPVRLVDGAGPYEGRVEIQINGQWGSVCHNNWINKDAEVVCRMLGFDSYGATAVGNALFGQGTGPVWVDYLNCQGSEKHLFECPSSSVIGGTGCNHGTDAGVVCNNWYRYPIRLVNGTGPWEGRVEIHAFGTWWTVSSNEWDNRDAQVVCNMLGYTNSIATAIVGSGSSGGVFGPNSGQWILDYMRCNGSETHLMQCDSPYTMSPKNTYDGYAAALCGSHYETFAKYPIRLVGGSQASEGRVEIEVNGEWGTVCNDYWDTNEARVVCRQLGFNSTNARAWTNSRFGHGSGHSFLDDMGCSGSESYLLQCPFPRLGLAQCSQGTDAGVTCA